MIVDFWCDKALSLSLHIALYFAVTKDPTISAHKEALWKLISIEYSIHEFMMLWYTPEN